ncbi:hypothetical protein C7H84_00235 [Burkholderia sp. Nafp2/4-1b]|nr:hypothetical protein C7H84_00235 [Burkholderia sp. Nafp2/4-1b]
MVSLVSRRHDGTRRMTVRAMRAAWPVRPMRSGPPRQGKRDPTAPSFGTAPAEQSKRNVARRYSDNAMR